MKPRILFFFFFSHTSRLEWVHEGSLDRIGIMFWANSILERKQINKGNDKGYIVKNKNKIKNIQIKSKCDSDARVRPPPPTERAVARLHGLKKDEIRWGVIQPSVFVGSSHHCIVRGEVDDPRSELLFPLQFFSMIIHICILIF